MQKVTIKDVAEKSQTSVRTVSRVINDHPNVKTSTRIRVQKVIEELDFKVNFVARSLKEQKTNQIVIFIDWRNGEYWGAFHNEIFHEIHRLAKYYNYRIVISASSPDIFEEDENDGFHLVKHKLCDGAIIFDPINNDQRVQYLKESNTPFVLIGDSHHDVDVSYVGVDNFYLGYLGAKSIYDHGYRSTQLFLGKKASIINQKRAQGYRSFCQEKGLIDNVYFGLSNLKAVYQKTLESIDSQQTDSFFVSGDERAIAVYRAIQERDIKIGKEVGVLGIDNLGMSEYLYPDLTTLAQPKQDIAKSTIDLLVEQINKHQHKTSQRILYPTLVERQSL
ncbi:LacI family DNA-binding transcriptional regulator [Virgibacillus sp. NKC19-3]|uniref:LacI family DNA-binding transcriptional regulator n=1 Tax=Virgibacillus saliphilus TaxID=2831674 RepID=UPI001C9BA175|nr:LacI family DNA-binding transcriptional regulator [Virgibacillus sp. NKC19-3]MBY7142108.1 LacI family DNA-binding transcriptional regulator [Virgibacillus sp. NKC19-3]